MRTSRYFTFTPEAGPRAAGDGRFDVHRRRDGVLLGWVRPSQARESRWVFGFNDRDWYGFFATRLDAADRLADVIEPSIGRGEDQKGSGRRARRTYPTSARQAPGAQGLGR